MSGPLAMTPADLGAEMPPAIVEQALDDDGDGAADAGLWERVEASADERLRAAFGREPGAEHATAARMAKRLFLLETLYARRGLGTGASNPYAARAADAERTLRRLASGEESQSGDAAPAVLGEPARLAGFGGIVG